MSTKNKRLFGRNLIAIGALLLSFSACTAGQVPPETGIPFSISQSDLTNANTNTGTAIEVPPPITTSVPLPEITLVPGETYFRVNGKPAFLFSRNLAGITPSDYEVLLALAQQSGTLVVRVGVDNQSMSVATFGYGFNSQGQIDEEWSSNWEHFFEAAEARGIYVLPMFTGWANWNSELDGWKRNPFNAANGGLAKDGTEFLVKDSPAQTLYLKWFKDVISRWQRHRNIFAWEVATEINLTPGVTEQEAIYFMERSAALIREADPARRPVTASLGGFPEWTEVWWHNFYKSDAITFTNIHPYPASGHLDTEIIRQTRMLLEEYKKPVLNGESGLNALEPDRGEGKITVAENAYRGIRHAIWAGVVSGAANGRALFWEDSYGVYFPQLGWPFLDKYKDIERPAATFMRDVDMTGLVPLKAQLPAGTNVAGAVLGNDKLIIGWFRDAGCEPPDWPLQPVISGQTIMVTVPGSTAEWSVDFYDTRTGTDIVSSMKTVRQGGQVFVLLPDFTDDIAFKMYPASGTTSTIPTHTAGSPASTTDPLAGKWMGAILGKNTSFSTTIELSIEPGCSVGRVCGTVTAPLLSCSGELFLREIQGTTFVLVEQNMTGAAACESGTLEYLKLEANGTLSIDTLYTSPSGEKSASSGKLRHP